MPAPRKALLPLTKKRKFELDASLVKDEEAKLKSIKTKYAARVLILCRSALRALKEITNIEADMDLEASEGVHNDYIDRVPDFKLTFEASYEQHAEEADDTSPRIDDCMDVLTAIQKDAVAAFSSEMAAEDAASHCC